MEQAIVTEDDTSLLGVAEAARRLGGISHWTLRKHIDRGNLAITRIGRPSIYQS